MLPSAATQVPGGRVVAVKAMLRVPRADGSGFEPDVFRSVVGEHMFTVGATYWLQDPWDVGVHARGFHAHSSAAACFAHDWGFTACNSVLAEVLLHGGKVLYDAAHATYAAPAVTIVRLLGA
jgi:hypothetical protein